jgi:glutathione S-transferase
MITLYSFGPAEGLPDLSPFVMKTMTLLKIAGLDYREDRAGYRRAPKGKLPFIDDNGTIVADSTFIRWHIEKTRNLDFDAHLTKEQRAVAWAAEKLCEDHLYWLVVRDRWLDENNFRRGPAKFFERAPALIRPLISGMVRRKISNALHVQGLGRHSPEEAAQIGRKGVDTLATLLGDTPYLFGERAGGADATLFAFVAGLLYKGWDSPLRTVAQQRPNLVRYRDRIMQQYFPNFANG